MTTVIVIFIYVCYSCNGGLTLLSVSFKYIVDAHLLPSIGSSSFGHLEWSDGFSGPTRSFDVGMLLFGTSWWILSSTKQREKIQWTQKRVFLCTLMQHGLTPLYENFCLAKIRGLFILGRLCLFLCLMMELFSSFGRLFLVLCHFLIFCLEYSREKKEVWK